MKNVTCFGRVARVAFVTLLFGGCIDAMNVLGLRINKMVLPLQSAVQGVIPTLEINFPKMSYQDALTIMSLKMLSNSKEFRSKIDKHKEEINKIIKKYYKPSTKYFTVVTPLSASMRLEWKIRVHKDIPVLVIDSKTVVIPKVMSEYIKQMAEMIDCFKKTKKLQKSIIKWYGMWYPPDDHSTKKEKKVMQTGQSLLQRKKRQTKTITKRQMQSSSLKKKKAARTKKRSSKKPTQPPSLNPKKIEQIKQDLPQDEQAKIKETAQIEKRSLKNMFIVKMLRSIMQRIRAFFCFLAFWK